MNTLNIIASLLYLVVGIITLIIGARFLFSRKFFPYHQEVVGLEWLEIKESIRILILAVFKMAGLGIVSLSIVIMLYSINGFMGGDISHGFKYGIPALAFLFWGGTFTVTLSVHRRTGANTPWIGSLVSMIMVILAFVCSVIRF